MSDKRFRVAFSFAGEKRDFVAPIAALLAARFAEERVLYDRFHEAEFARARLGRYLPKLYHEESDLVVVLVCPDYAKKEWCGLEWDAVLDLLKKRREDEVMLCRFGHATIDGLFSDAGYSDLDDRTPDQVVTLILERLAINENKPKDYYTRPCNAGTEVPFTSIPNNLPRLQPFFGRAEELQRIAEALDVGNPTWGALIDGPGGMGKTSLAIRAAHNCAARWFHRIIFLSVKTCELDDEGVRQLGVFILPGFLEMANELARELGQPEIMKARKSRRVPLLLNALRATQTLLILDNLESLPKSDRDKLLTFLKHLPQGCKALLTCRRRIGSMSEELLLEELDQNAALATLADLARHNKLLARTADHERVALWKRTGGRPLLLRWVAGQLGRGNCRTLTDALHFLSTCPPENDPLEFVFGDLVEEFTLEETRVLCALTHFTQPARIEHIAEVIRLDRESIHTALRGLVNRSLVIADQDEEVFALVPMVAEFLRRKRSEVTAEIGTCLEEYAYAIIVKNGGDKYKCFPVIDAAWPIIASALPLFLVGANDRLQSVCQKLASFFNFTGRWDEWLSLNEQAERRALAVGDHDGAGWRAYHAGYVHFLRQEAQPLFSCSSRAEFHWQASKAGERARAIAIHLRAMGYHFMQDYPAAIAAYREVVSLHTDLMPESSDVAVALNGLAEAERKWGDLAAAEGDWLKALQIARTVHDTEGVASITGNLTAVAIARRDWPRAATLSREALSLAEKMGRQELIADGHLHLAVALHGQGKKPESLQHARQAVEIFTKLASPLLEEARKLLRDLEG